MERELKTVAEFQDVMSAEIAAGNLRANGIDAEIFGENYAYPSISFASGIKLKVKAEDFEAACGLLGKAGE